MYKFSRYVNFEVFAVIVTREIFILEISHLYAVIAEPPYKNWDTCEWPHSKMMARFDFTSCIQGCHVYKDLWTATVGEEVSEDPYAIVLNKDGSVVGQAP